MSRVFFPTLEERLFEIGTPFATTAATRAADVRCSSQSPTLHRPEQENNAMFSPFSSVHRRKPLKITCDAPAFEVVLASRGVGLHWPEDVRWRRQALPKGAPAKRRGLIRRIWRLLSAFDVPEIEETCACGSPLPERRFILLRTRAGAQIRYAVAQCGRCRSIAWDEERM
jgi:hypothetical protein